MFCKLYKVGAGLALRTFRSCSHMQRVMHGFPLPQQKLLLHTIYYLLIKHWVAGFHGLYTIIGLLHCFIAGQTASSQDVQHW